MRIWLFLRINRTGNADRAVMTISDGFSKVDSVLIEIDQTSSIDVILI